MDVIDWNFSIDEKKTVLTVLTALVKSDVKSRNSSLAFTENSIFFFTAILKDYHSEGALNVYLLLVDKKTNTKTKLGALQTILRDKQIKTHNMIL